MLASFGAAATLLTWGDRRITPLALATGMTSVQWRGRLEPLTSGPFHKLAGAAELWIDCGSSLQAAGALAHAMRDMNRKRRARTTAIIGMRADDAWGAFVRRLAPELDALIAVPLGPDGANPGAIADTARDMSVSPHTADTLRGALTIAGDIEAERILVCGSISLAAQALQESRPIV